MITLQSESSGDGNSEWFMSIVGCKLTTFSGNRGKFGKKSGKIGKASSEQANWNAGLGYIWWNFSAICVGVKYCVLGGAH